MGKSETQVSGHILHHPTSQRTLAEEFIVYSNRSSSRLKHGLIAPSFASKCIQNYIFYRGAILLNAIG